MKANISKLIEAAEDLTSDPRAQLAASIEKEIPLEDGEGFTLKMVLQSREPVNVLELLAKYIQYVEECEGTNFIGTHHHGLTFTEDEFKLLKDLESE